MMTKTRLMRVFSVLQGRMVWVPRVLWEMDYRVADVSKAAPWIQTAIYRATQFNNAESRRLYQERRG